MHYDVDQKITVVSAQEKLIDATTGFGAAYSFGGRVMHQLPKIVSVSFFGYHNTVQWQSIKTLTFSCNGRTYTAPAFRTLYGKDRDKGQDLVQANYFDSVLAPLPLPIAQQIFSSTVFVTSSPPGLQFQLTAQQTDRCHELLLTIPKMMALRAPDLQKSASSANGLPVTRNIAESSGDVTLATTGTLLSSRFSMQFLAFITQSGKQVRQPNTALLLAETGDAPVLENEKGLTLNYGDTRLDLVSNVNQTQTSESGTKLSVRTYVIPYRRFLTISKMKSLSLTVGNTTIPIPAGKMAGIREIARRIQH